MKKKIIIISIIAVLVVSVASVAGVWAYGEMSKQLAENDTSLIETAPIGMSVTVDESDKIGKLMVEGKQTLKEMLEVLDEDYEYTPLNLYMWNPDIEKSFVYVRPEWIEDWYTKNDDYLIKLATSDEYHNSYLCMRAKISNSVGDCYYLELALMATEKEKAELTVFKIEKATGFEEVYDERLGYNRSVTKTEAVFFNHKFNFQFKTVPDEAAFEKSFLNKQMSFEIDSEFDYAPTSPFFSVSNQTK